MTWGEASRVRATRLVGVRPAALVLLAFILPVPCSGQDATIDRFASVAAGHVARFASVETAIAEGYRKLGPDFPGMGEHWINPSLVIGGAMDPVRPPVLCYITAEEGRRLVGFAYTQVLAPGEKPPDSPFPRDAWHDHTGGIDEESLLLSGPVSAHTGADGYRLAMVHVWSPAANHDGLLVQNNWSLPFLRAGLSPPENVPTPAARALSLAGDGLPFYKGLLREGMRLEGDDLRAAEAAFAFAAREAVIWLEGQEGGLEVSRDRIEGLERIWSSLWVRLEENVSAETFEELGILRVGGGRR